MVRGLTEVRIWWPRMMVEAWNIGAGSLFIVLLISAFAGAVTALQTGYQFTGSIPYYVVGTLVVSSIILELGPVLTALILAGRIGARYAAELGTMRVTEQIDALESLGRSPASHLVIPRVLAGLIMIPALTILANLSGIALRVGLGQGGAAGHRRRLHLRRAVLLAPVGRMVLGDQGVLLRRLASRSSRATWDSTPSRAPKAWARARPPPS